MVGSFTKVLSGNMDFKKSKSSHLGMATMPPIKMVMTVDGLDVIVNMIHPFNHIYIYIYPLWLVAWNILLSIYWEE